MEVLQPSQRIALHDLTSQDISILVRGKLNGVKHFQQLEGKNAVGCKNLVESIIQDAEGVFLWVTLMLRDLEDALHRKAELSSLEYILSPRTSKGALAPTHPFSGPSCGLEPHMTL